MKTLTIEKMESVNGGLCKREQDVLDWLWANGHYQQFAIVALYMTTSPGYQSICNT